MPVRGHRLPAGQTCQRVHPKRAGIANRTNLTPEKGGIVASGRALVVLWSQGRGVNRGSPRVRGLQRFSTPAAGCGTKRNTDPGRCTITRAICGVMRSADTSRRCNQRRWKRDPPGPRKRGSFRKCRRRGEGRNAIDRVAFFTVCTLRRRASSPRGKHEVF